MAKKPVHPDPTLDPSLRVTRTKITDYRPAEVNPNLGSLRGVPAIIDSLNYNGAGRSGLADRDGEMIAGSHTLQALQDAGIEDVIEIETTGKEWVVVKRIDLDLTHDARARSLQISDNRTGQLGYVEDTQLVARLLAQVGQEDVLLVQAAGYNEADIRLLTGGTTPSLGELEKVHGVTSERDFWPSIQLQVSPQTFARYRALMERCDGEDAEKFEALMGAIDETLLSSKLP